MHKILLAATFLIIIQALTSSLNSHELFRHSWYSPTLTLSFQYACNEDVDLEDCSFAVQWGETTLKQIVPIDYQVHHETIRVEAGPKYGKNTLKLMSLGNNKEGGIGLTNVQMARKHHAFRRVAMQSMLNDSQFDQGYEGQSNRVKTLNGSGAWEGFNFQIGPGRAFNSDWSKDSQVCQLASNHWISQNIYIGRRYTLLSKQTYDRLSELEKELTLLFFYAPQMNSSLADSSFEVLWNGKVVKIVEPQSYEKKRLGITLRIVPGVKNVVSFRSRGTAKAGPAIDQVYLDRRFSLFTKRHQKHNLIVNGWFEDQRFLISKEETIFDNGTNGWKGSPLQTVISTNFNTNFDQKAINHLILCKLSPTAPISQEFYFDSQYNLQKPPTASDKSLTLGFSYAADPTLPLADSAFSITFNGKTLDSIVPNDYKKHYRTYNVEGKIGQNSLHFVGQGGKKDQGAGITYISLQRSQPRFRPMTLITNSKFMAYGKGCSIRSWKGNNIRAVPGKEYGHSWGWQSRDCVCPLGSNTEVYQEFELDKEYQYVDAKQSTLSLSLKKSLKLSFGFFPQPKVPLSDSRFDIQWNGKVVKRFSPDSYKQHQQSVTVQIQVGENTLRFIGTGEEEGRGGAFNYVYIERGSDLFHPVRLHSILLLKQRWEKCPEKLSFWKGNVQIIKGSDFSFDAFTQDCVVQLRKGEQFEGTFKFNSKFQSRG